MIVSFSQITPPARFDGQAWTQVRIDESPAASGPWQEIDELALDELPEEASSPLPVSFTTALALLDDGWYRLTFISADGEESNPLAPIRNSPDIQPSLRDVSALLRARINDADSDVFTDATYPTADQVINFIVEATADIQSRVVVIPDGQRSKARYLAALQTARLIELSYFPEQSNEDRSVFANLTDLFNPAMTEFITNCRTPMITTLA